MKKITLLSAVALATLALASLARAQETAVEFYGNASLDSTTPAGIDQATGWNTLALPNNYLPYGGSAFTTETGTYNGIGVALSSDGWYNNSAANQIANDPGSTTLLAQGAGTEGTGSGSGAIDPVTLTLTGLTAGQEYSLVVYVGGAPSCLAAGSLALTGAATGDETQYFMSPGGDGVQGSATSLIDNATTTNWTSSLTTGSSIPAGEPYISNYMIFSGITGSSLTVTLDMLGNFPYGAYNPNGPELLGESGFELLDTGSAPVPEPSTVWMFSLGFLGLMVHVYRKRSARI